jgi:hypothetical protein
LLSVRKELCQSTRERTGFVSSFLQTAIDKRLNFAENIRQLRLTAVYNQKQKLQYLLFPEGMLYDKNNDRLLTSKVNSIFDEIAVQGSVLDDKINGNLLQNCHYGSYVGLLGFEPRRTESKSVVLPLHYNPIAYSKLLLRVQI